ncbi:MAG: VTC domain-containing protein [Chloroflexota bacterium]
MITTRQTIKFSLPARLQPALAELITAHLPLHEEAPGALANRVESVYLDTRDLALYRQAALDPSQRTLLRLRAYNGRRPVFAEMKQATQGSSSKLRVELAEALPRQPVVVQWGELLRRPAALPADYQALLAAASAAVELERLTPVLQVRYRRQAFEAAVSPGLRITLDSHVLMTALCDGGRRGRSYRLPHPIVEVKLQAAPPAWLAGLLEDAALTPLADFCKYAHGVAMLFAAPRGLALPAWASSYMSAPSPRPASRSAAE